MEAGRVLRRSRAKPLRVVGNLEEEEPQTQKGFRV